jgi:hypothetical protein
MRTCGWLILAATLAALPPTLLAQDIPTGTETYTLEGFAAKDQASAQAKGWFAISYGVVGKGQAPERWIGLTAFKDWDDDPFVGRQVIRNLMPADPTLLIDGPPALVKQMTSASPGSRIVARGMLNRTSRNFMLSGVQVKAPGGGAGTGN